MARFCASCGAQVAEGVAFCPACGKGVGQPAGGGYAAAPAPAPVSSTAASTGGLADNVAGLLAYITIIPAIIFLVMEPYNRKPFVRFHSFQSIFFGIACVVVAIVLSIIGVIPVLGWATLLLWPLVMIAELVIWVVLLIKANSGLMWKLPVIGDMAEKQANAV
ncbi:MAG: DUF4870 domain-containing protein [Terriglobales bacterium]